MVAGKARSPRYISDKITLEKYGATAVLDEEDQPIGIEIGGWTITTSSSSIGNEGQMEALTSKLELVIEGTYRRRISHPEIVFVDAFVSVKCDRQKKHSEVSAGSSSSAALSEIIFSAQDALIEWASCHNHLSTTSTTESATEEQSTTLTSHYKGVSIIKTVDAKLWEERKAREHKQQQKKNEDDDDADNSCGLLDEYSTEFNYDWTFSTPYTGTIIIETGESSSSSTLPMWEEMERSGLDLVLLSDQTQPILYFDDVHLYEDDMHDNGYVSLRCKIRVMPTCFFILLSLFVRVDRVLIRVKEVRFFFKFSPVVGDVCVDEKEGDGENGGSNTTSSTNSSNVGSLHIYRDVTWREISWDGLAAKGLPTHIGSWRIEDDAHGDPIQQQQRIQGMIRAIPEVELPMDIYRHGSLKLS